MGLILAPILEGKLEAWKSWASDLKGSKKNEFDDFNNRYGLTRHEAWLAETPDRPMVVVIHEGPGADSLMQELGHSDNSFDKSFARSVEEFHGLDLNAPPPGPQPERII